MLIEGMIYFAEIHQTMCKIIEIQQEVEFAAKQAFKYKSFVVDEYITELQQIGTNFSNKFVQKFRFIILNQFQQIFIFNFSTN